MNRLLSAFMLTALLGSTVKCSDRKVSITVLEESGAIRDNDLPLIASQLYYIVCTVTSSEPISNLTVSISQPNSEPSELPLVKRTGNSVTHELAPAFLTNNDTTVRSAYILLACRSSPDENADVEERQFFAVCGRLETPKIEIQQLVNSFDTLRITVTPSALSQAKTVQCGGLSSVERYISVSMIYPNGNYGSTFQCKFSHTSVVELCGKTIVHDLSLTYIVSVTDTHRIPPINSSLVTVQTTSVSRAASASDVILLDTLQSFDCTGLMNAIQLYWTDSRLLGEALRPVNASIDCQCSRLSAFGPPLAAGRFLASSSNSVVSRTRVTVPSGARCNCAITRRYGNAPFVSKPRHATCESNDDFPTSEPIAILGRFGVVASEVSLGVHLLWPPIEQLAGVASYIKLQVMDEVAGERRLLLHRTVFPNSSFVELTAVASNGSLLLLLQAATRRGYNPNNVPTQLRFSTIATRTCDNLMTAFRCTNAVTVDVETGILHFQFRCLNNKNFMACGNSNNEPPRVRFVLTALACLLNQQTTDFSGCNQSVTFYTTRTFESIKQLNQESMSITVETDSISNQEMLIKSTGNPTQQSVLFGQSLSVLDVANEQVLYSTGLLTPSCVYRASAIADAPRIEIQNGTSYSPPIVVFTLPHCGDSWSMRKGLISELLIRSCLLSMNDANQSSNCVDKHFLIPFCGTVSEPWEVSLDFVAADEVHQLQFAWKTVNGSWTWNVRKYVVSSLLASGSDSQSTFIVVTVVVLLVATGISIAVAVTIRNCYKRNKEKHESWRKDLPLVVDPTCLVPDQYATNELLLCTSDGCSTIANK